MGRAAFLFSLLILVVGTASAGQYADLRDRLQRVPDAGTVIAEVGKLAPDDPDILEALNSASTATDPKVKAKLAEKLKVLVELRALGERVSPKTKSPNAPNLEPVATAKSVKSNPLYRDAGIDEESNWLGRALARLKNLRFNPNWNTPRANPNLNLFGPWVIYVMWGFLGVAVAVLLFLAIRHIDWKRRLSRKASAILEEDEPERTVDEWLERADSLAASGLHREAVRALYLACLLRFDEYRVARFIRGQTNWEHLRRIQSSPRKPTDLDFSPATRAFDRIWYGRRIQGMSDVDQFRRWYQEVSEALASDKSSRKGAAV